MKYGNIPTTVNGKSFQSKLEGGRYAELCLLERAKEISGLETQVTYRLDVNGQHICKYIADFVYLDKRGNLVVEDTKSRATVTDTYRLKKKLMRACHGIEIQEVYKVSRKLPAGRKVGR